ncbi:MAG: methyltransferase domain-containing protein [Candidatus Solibacter sp.]
MRIALVLAGGVTFALLAQNARIENLAPFTETPMMVADRMLAMAELRPGEKMFDLGSGDGRIVILAARQYKADATGVEFDPALVKQSLELIKQAGISTLARIIEGDLLKQDYSAADLLTIYLLPIANQRLIPIFEKQLKRGARVVSHNTPLVPWTPEKVETITDDGQGRSHKLYLYRR